MLDLAELYKRYNQFSECCAAIPVDNQFTLINLYRDLKNEEIDIEKWLMNDYMEKVKKRMAARQELAFDKDFIQPKSIFFRIDLLGIISDSIPSAVYERLDITSETIIDLTMAIALYYLGLQTFKFSKKPITDTERKNIIKGDSFYITLEDLKIVRGKTTNIEFESYLRLFARNINDIEKNDNIGLFLDDGNVFIISVEDFVDYIVFELEAVFKKSSSKEEYDLFVAEKGKRFEMMVFSTVRSFFRETYHTLYYYPNATQEMEVDILLKDNDNIAVLECKSGTLNLYGIEKDDYVKLQIKNKTKKAYKTLKNLSDYFDNSSVYDFKSEQGRITGETNNLVCMHVTMYPLDFISSNLHSLFSDYLNCNPILTISMEHLFAILLDSKRRNKDIFKYWEKRKRDVIEYPEMHFDNNELDLYHELTNDNENSILSELKKQGILHQMKPHGYIISSFRNQYGEEFRPAQNMLRMLDMYLLYGIFEKGKSSFGLNKRYLKNLESYYCREY